MVNTLVEYYFGATKDVVRFETIEISHPDFSKTHFLVANHYDGLTATLEDGRVIDFEHVPMRVPKVGVSENLDQTLLIELGDVGEIAAKEDANIEAAGGFGRLPDVIIREFRSDDLSGPMSGPYQLEIFNFGFTQGGVAFEAGPQSLNTNRTGETQSIDTFPMLRGFL